MTGEPLSFNTSRICYCVCLFLRPFLLSANNMQVFSVTTAILAAVRAWNLIYHCYQTKNCTVCFKQNATKKILTIGVICDSFVSSRVVSKISRHSWDIPRALWCRSTQFGNHWFIRLKIKSSLIKSLSFAQKSSTGYNWDILPSRRSIVETRDISSNIGRLACLVGYVLISVTPRGFSVRWYDLWSWTRRISMTYLIRHTVD
jgi:hypothetical protein